MVLLQLYRIVLCLRFTITFFAVFSHYCNYNPCMIFKTVVQASNNESFLYTLC